ncbi:MAG: uroporphyrinogen decarboxylase family protein [Candidatus Latescibacterota bacterium]|jgi:uroporphyrinogen decarboxylase
MDGRERFNRVMRFESVDRVPNYELGLWGQTVERWYGEGMPRNSVYMNWFEGEPFYRLDRRAFAPLHTGMIPGFVPEVLAEDERYITARHADGVVTKALKEGTVLGTRPSMDQYLSHPVIDRAGFAEMRKRYDPSALIRYPLWWDEMVRCWQGRDYPLCLLTNGTIGLYAQLRSWVGTEEISYLFFDDPILVDEMVEFIVDFTLRLTERARREIRFDYFNFFEDFAGKGGPLVSPALFRRFLLPGYRRIVDEFRRSGIDGIWLDSDGDTRTLIPLLIEAGVTCHWPLEQASDMEPLALRREYGTALAFAGGIDKRALTAGRREIEREVNAKIPAMLESGGFIPHLDHTFPPDIPYANFLYYLELKEKVL